MRLAVQIAATHIPLQLLGWKGLANAQEVVSRTAVIRYLTYQSDRPDKHGAVKGRFLAFSCGPALGEDRDDRALARSLVKLGASAVPALEQAFDSFQSEIPAEMGWLLLAYARLKASAAYPRLKRMYGDSGLASHAGELDAALALAFGFTSYLSALRGTQIYQYHECIGVNGNSSVSRTPCVAPRREVPIRSIHCHRGNEPRDSLDRLILAWQMGNRTSVEAGLGPTARSALAEALESKNWDSLRAELRAGISGRSVAMAYRFNISGRWSEPDETLEEQREQTTLPGDPHRFEIETLFYDSSGNGCGRHRLYFLAIPESGWYDAGHPSRQVPGPTEYVIDNSNISDLLRLVFACSAENSPANQVP